MTDNRKVQRIKGRERERENFHPIPVFVYLIASMTFRASHGKPFSLCTNRIPE
jgi:hypothetical protein